jgi:hypothetical protein
VHSFPTALFVGGEGECHSFATTAPVVVVATLLGVTLGVETEVVVVGKVVAAAARW